MRVPLLAGLWICVALGMSLEGQGPLAPFHGSYRVVQSPGGTVRVSDVLGGSFTEWTVAVGEPPHERRLFVGTRRADGTFPVWRFEQEPAALVAHAGTGRLQGLEFIADFVSSSGETGKFLRERWRLTPEGGLEFHLEAAGEGAGPRRVGGFRATRP